MPDSSLKPRPHVVFIGPMASGKTRIGKRVARILDVPFVDTDKRIVAEHGSISGIFAEHGEPHFRELETAAVLSALDEDAVVSLGGGAVMTPAIADALQGHEVVLLTISPEAAEPRITGDSRPMLTGGLQSWIELAEKRMPTYERLAGARWDTSTRPADQIAQEIADWARRVTQ